MNPVAFLGPYDLHSHNMKYLTTNNTQDFFGHPCVGLETSGSGSQDSGVFFPVQVDMDQLEELQQQLEEQREELLRTEKKLQKSEQQVAKLEKTNEMLVGQLKKTDTALAKARESSNNYQK